ncbi:MAG: Rrf2 family transcriptional regulator [Longicatena sp.]|jgi:Rrf2 family protein|uniref:RrF2 family transcriptional regulator n=1 Tax=Anaerorhabdus sp. TaxID=1872524 RepID=UPI002FCC97E2
MKFKTTTDYAIRIICYLAKENKVKSSEEIAKELKIPLSYISKVTKDLKSAQMIKAIEGIRGGYRLICDAEQVTLYDVIVASGDQIIINKCLLDKDCCTRDASEHCQVRVAYEKVRTTIILELKGITISSLINVGGNSNDEKHF